MLIFSRSLRFDYRIGEEIWAKTLSMMIFCITSSTTIGIKIPMDMTYSFLRAISCLAYAYEIKNKLEAKENKHVLLYYWKGWNNTGCDVQQPEVLWLACRLYLTRGFYRSWSLHRTMTEWRSKVSTNTLKIIKIHPYAELLWCF